MHNITERIINDLNEVNLLLETIKANYFKDPKGVIFFYDQHKLNKLVASIDIDLLRSDIPEEEAKQTARPEEKIIQKQKEYIQLLNDELHELYGLAHGHGWKSTRVEAGKKIRAELKELENKQP